MSKRISVMALVGLIAMSCGKDGISTDANKIGNNGDATAEEPRSKITGLSVWHWGSETRPNGINNIILDEGKSKEAINSYLENAVTRVYGGYSKIPGHPTQKENLAKWNIRLHQSGIKSIYLVGNAKWIYPENRQEMHDYITRYYIKFNASVPTDSKLKGLHVDLEPHQLVEWSMASLERKRELLYLLKDTYRDLRTLLVQNGMKSDEIMADIPTWFDETSVIGWSSETEKYTWFNDAAKYLSGFTIMAYELESVSTIIKKTNWERDNFKGIIQIGLNADEIGSVWDNRSHVFNVLNDIRVQTLAPVAIHNYTTIMGN